MDRKKIKKQAKMLMKKHFGFLVAICLVSAMITSEFGGTLSWIFSQNNEAINEEMTALPSDLSTSKVLQDIFDDNLDAGEKMADEIKQSDIYVRTGIARFLRAWQTAAQAVRSNPGIVHTRRLLRGASLRSRPGQAKRKKDGLGKKNHHNFFHSRFSSFLYV